MFRLSFVVTATVCLCASLMWTPGASAGHRASIAPVPPGMSFEEFEDVNRTVLGGLPWLVVPGGLHFYANDNTRGWILAGTAAAGVVAIILGAATSGEGDGDFATDHEVVSFGEGDKERFYAKAPVHRTETTAADGTVTSETQYRLDQVGREGGGGGGLLIVLGSMALVSSYVADFFHGMHTIRLKRNRARYEYGKRAAELKLLPTVAVDPEGGGAGGVKMELRF